MKAEAFVSIPHNFEPDDLPETLRLKLGEFARSIEDLFNQQVSIFVTYAQNQPIPTLSKGDIVMDFSANRGFATLQQYDGRKLVPLSIASTSIIGLVNLITQGTGSGSNPALFLRSDGANGWVLAAPPAGFANPMTAVGDLILGGTVVAGVATPTRLGIGANNYVLTSNGSSAIWSAAAVTTGGAIQIAVSGTQNGINLVFTLAAAVTAGVALVFLNGQLLTSTVDYTISGTTLTFISPTIPVAADIISVYGYTGTAFVTQVAGGLGAPPAIIPFM